MTGLWGAKCREAKAPAVARFVTPGAQAIRAVELKGFQSSDASRAFRPAAEFKRQGTNSPACL